MTEGRERRARDGNRVALIYCCGQENSLTDRHPDREVTRLLREQVNMGHSLTLEGIGA